MNARTEGLLDIGRAGDPSVFPARIREAAAELIARYPAGQERSALLPLLHLVQSEQGCVSADGIAFCADQLGITKAQVAAVATFYTMYKRSPTGEFLVSVCTNALCGMLGGDRIYEVLSQVLEVGNQETTPDGLITLEHAECLAACDYAPVLTVNYEFFDQQTPESAAALVAELQRGGRPHPTRGAPLCTFREIERQIAGLPDERPEALTAEAIGDPSTAGVRLAVELRQSAPSYATMATDLPAEDPGGPYSGPPGAHAGPAAGAPLTKGD
ncbi:MAG: NADH-quinone oxidoreductase subunit NuoE [Frankiaceae bacterium]|jgi:NADH-quinone oxidoreductase subunit E|nr:NADH-quinone oxidoreductase subunit NuoE [Frankiaceae bacterium]